MAFSRQAVGASETGQRRSVQPVRRWPHLAGSRSRLPDPNQPDKRPSSASIHHCQTAPALVQLSRLPSAATDTAAAATVAKEVSNWSHACPDPHTDAVANTVRIGHLLRFLAHPDLAANFPHQPTDDAHFSRATYPRTRFPSPRSPPYLLLSVLRPLFIFL